jgi:hypothetical protein
LQLVVEWAQVQTQVQVSVAQVVAADEMAEILVALDTLAKEMAVAQPLAKTLDLVVVVVVVALVALVNLVVIGACRHQVLLLNLLALVVQDCIG